MGCAVNLCALLRGNQALAVLPGDSVSCGDSDGPKDVSLIQRAFQMVFHEDFDGPEGVPLIQRAFQGDFDGPEGVLLVPRVFQRYRSRRGTVEPEGVPGRIRRPRRCTVHPGCSGMRLLSRIFINAHYPIAFIILAIFINSKTFPKNIYFRA